MHISGVREVRCHDRSDDDEDKDEDEIERTSDWPIQGIYHGLSPKSITQSWKVGFKATPTVLILLYIGYIHLNLALQIDLSETAAPTQGSTLTSSSCRFSSHAQVQLLFAIPHLSPIHFIYDLSWLLYVSSAESMHAFFVSQKHA
ncbi:hypothetical protein BCR41DRAFT_392131 [Lobosporangium transversale]|uniref:Uncharacterized protein n=1 Tax=Lobosporangium transversale TaxID=64571 RepID=A0A1Y2H0V1_9FUNG|nr:hypothetical protein BCR41DRAFT_392131 [Lobosporangium transversale]ORZ27674.1 hypothetical protein BCR41DRAFT_392131 [Lobosporangium transversale]|eukprot:XP_021885377.1 hypothetical protein BCR41DRAFT_392131 [Lobosporangium transversale]